MIFSKKQSNIRLLDVGCGDGHFLSELSTRITGDLKGFEPFMKETVYNKDDIFLKWEQIDKYAEREGRFDIVTCFEVFEHLNVLLQSKTLQHISEVMTNSGSLIVSVPIEKGFPSLVKNLFRKMSASKNDSYYSWKRIWTSLFGKPIPECRGNEDYLFHMGFYYTDLEEMFDKYFIIEKRTYSPFTFLGFNFNSQVFYKLNKKQ